MLLMEWVMMIALMANVLMQAFDFYSTKKFLSKNRTETNKLMLWAMNKFGVTPTLLIAKGGMIVLLVAFWFLCDYFLLYWIGIVLYLALMIFYLIKLRNNIAAFTDNP